MSQSYHYVRFKWWRGNDMKRVAKELEGFKIEEIELPKDKDEVSLFKDEREELRAKADTLTAFLAPARAVLTQRETAPFTPKDLELREKVMKLYPHDRPTPFPWEWSIEPKFEVAK